MVNVIWMIGALLVPLVWLVPHVAMGMHPDPAITATLTGVTIVSAAFLLSWATELAENYVPASFALIILALISVLPEYAVDITLAWKAGQDPAYRELAVANMTGANRILIGIGWSMLVFVQVFQGKGKVLEVHPSQRLELGFLLIATIYAIILPLKQSIGLIDSAVFFLIFAAYVWRSLKTEGEEHPLVGPSLWINDRTKDPSRIAVIAFFLVYACAAIWFSAEPFAEGLVQVGEEFDIDKFVLIQVVAPLASESPEFIVAILFVLRNRASTALGALVSSKVNQWTLLVGAIPIAYSLSKGSMEPMLLEPRPNEELLLTAAQSLFAVALLSDLRFTLKEAIALFVLFLLPWAPGLNAPGMHYVFSGLYFVLVLVVGFGNDSARRNLARLFKLRG